MTLCRQWTERMFELLGVSTHPQGRNGPGEDGRAGPQVKSLRLHVHNRRGQTQDAGHLSYWDSRTLTWSGQV